MAGLHEKLQAIYEEVGQRNAGEQEFHQAVYEVLTSLGPVVAKHPEYADGAIIRRLCEPERQIIFRVPWHDDSGAAQINRGFRVEFNSALGPFKGGLRFHPSVYLGIVKFLGFEQIFKNSLTGLPIGGGKGGSDFDPKGRSDAEIMRFCQSFMTELYRHIGEYTDVPAGDIGVGMREIGYLFGQYKRITNRYESGVLTGKGSHLGRLAGPHRGHRIRHRVLRRRDPRARAGSPSRASRWWCPARATWRSTRSRRCTRWAGPSWPARTPAATCATTRASTSTCSRRSKNCAGAASRTTPEARGGAAEVVTGRSVWEVPCDIALPCATQNEVSGADATALIRSGCQIVAEGANMPCTLEAVKFFEEAGVRFAPGKAANAGGVATSALEMQQNASRDSWTFDDTEARLAEIMRRIHDRCLTTADEYGPAGQLRRRRQHRRLHPGGRRDAGPGLGLRALPGDPPS